MSNSFRTVWALTAFRFGLHWAATTDAKGLSFIANSATLFTFNDGLMYEADAWLLLHGDLV